MDNKFQNGKIYKITSPHTDKCYIGSTTESLEYRLKRHTWHFKGDGLKGKMSSIEIIKCGDAKIELIKDFPCNSKRELEQEEAKYILLDRGNCVNKNLSYHLKKDIDREYYLKNKKKHNDQSKAYNQLNKDKQKKQIQERAKIDYNCVCGSIVRYTKKSDHHKTKKHLNYLEHNVITK